MVGKVREVPQTQRTQFWPRSPYGVSKVFARYMTINYRESYDMHASCGILFNHESPVRGAEFVTRKISRGVFDAGADESPSRSALCHAREKARRSRSVREGGAQRRTA